MPASRKPLAPCQVFSRHPVARVSNLPNRSASSLRGICLSGRHFVSHFVWYLVREGRFSANSTKWETKCDGVDVK